jgi:hypothetical protein
VKLEAKTDRKSASESERKMLNVIYRCFHHQRYSIKCSFSLIGWSIFYFLRIWMTEMESGTRRNWNPRGKIGLGIGRMIELFTFWVDFGRKLRKWAIWWKLLLVHSDCLKVKAKLGSDGCKNCSLIPPNLRWKLCRNDHCSTRKKLPVSPFPNYSSRFKQLSTEFPLIKIAFNS